MRHDNAPQQAMACLGLVTNFKINSFAIGDMATHPFEMGLIDNVATWLPRFNLEKRYNCKG